MKTDDTEERIDVDAEWERMIERNLNRWRQPAEAVRQDTIEAIRRRVYGPDTTEEPVERYDDGNKPDVEAAYEAMVQRNLNAWKKRGV